MTVLSVRVILPYFVAARGDSASCRKKQLLSNLVHQRVLHPTSLSDVILASLATSLVSVDSELHTYMTANGGLACFVDFDQ